MVAAVRGYSIDIACWKCGLEFNVLVNIDDFIDWKSGEKYIQEAFPYLAAAERELLLSGTCDDCWQILYELESRDDENE